MTKLIQSVKTRKRNGLARRKWTKINVQISKMPKRICKRAYQKYGCDHFALFVKNI